MKIMKLNSDLLTKIEDVLSRVDVSVTTSHDRGLHRDVVLHAWPCQSKDREVQVEITDVRAVSPVLQALQRYGFTVQRDLGNRDSTYLRVRQ